MVKPGSSPVSNKPYIQNVPSSLAEDTKLFPKSKTNSPGATPSLPAAHAVASYVYLLANCTSLVNDLVQHEAKVVCLQIARTAVKSPPAVKYSLITLSASPLCD